jgi:hypothetical protein
MEHHPPVFRDIRRARCKAPPPTPPLPAFLPVFPAFPVEGVDALEEFEKDGAKFARSRRGV